MAFCTLFDSNYADKGLVLYKSLKATMQDFELYILAMDELVNNILTTLNYDKIKVIKLEDFVSFMGLGDAKKNRTRAEFCWTCTPFLIDYVIRKYNEPICTYIDADMYFFKDPTDLINEMHDKNVQIVEHRFTNSLYDKYAKKTAGTYCVEFNTFKNEQKSMDLLKWWEDRCKESCSQNGVEGVMGDQYYLNDWGDKENVSVLQNLGGGVAPWNVGQYKLVSSNAAISFKKRRENTIYDLVFYHFHNLSYIDKNKVNISVYQRRLFVDKQLVNKIYFRYLEELKSAKEYLEDNFGFYPLIIKHPGFANNVKKDHNILKKIGQSLKENGLIKTIEVAMLIVRDKIVCVINGKKNILTITEKVDKWTI